MRSERGGMGMMRKRKKRQCVFCITQKEPNYLDLESLDSFISEKKRIMPRRITGTCAVHQRRLTRSIKRARYLAFLPYVQSGE